MNVERRVASRCSLVCTFGRGGLHIVTAILDESQRRGGAIVVVAWVCSVLVDICSRKHHCEGVGAVAVTSWNRCCSRNGGERSCCTV